MTVYRMIGTGCDRIPLVSDPITLTVAGGIADLRLDNPAAGNSIDPPFARAIRAHAESLHGREDVRVVRLSAAGKAFCVGGDLGFFAGADDRRAALHGLATDLHAGMVALAELDAPVVARVHGVAAGAGMSLVCAADIAIGSPAASFTVAYTGVGLSPDGGSSWLLPRLVGLRRAADLMLTNRRVKAQEALAIGLLTEVVAEDELDTRVDELVARLAAGPTTSYGAVKRLLRESATTGFEAQLRAEADSIAALAASPTGIEGVAAFLEKRPPAFP